MQEVVKKEVVKCDNQSSSSIDMVNESIQEPVGSKAIDEADVKGKNNLLHNSSLTLKHVEQGFIIDKVFKRNGHKCKPTIKGSSYCPT